MTTFWKNYIYLCQKNGETVYEAASKSGASNSSGTISNWRNGSSPQGEKLEKLANHFKVSANDLLTADIKRAETGIATDPSPYDDPFVAQVMALTPKQRSLVQAFIAGMNANPNNPF